MVYHKLNSIHITLLLVVIMFLMHTADSFVKETFAFLLFLGVIMLIFENYMQNIYDNVYKDIIKINSQDN